MQYTGDTASSAQLTPLEGANLGINLLKLSVPVGEGSDLRRAHKCEVERVEEEDDILALHGRLSILARLLYVRLLVMHSALCLRWQWPQDCQDSKAINTNMYR